jgi:hypothetical protein
MVPERILTDDPQLKADLQEILLRPKYSEIFAWRKWKFISGVPKIRLNWKANMPAYHPAAPRPCPIPKQDAAAHSIQRFVDQGFWVPAGISPRYATPVVLVWKPDLSIRVCADYTTFVNKWLAPFEAPAPLIQQELERLAKYPRFINVDIRDAFYTLGLDASDSEKLVVATHLGYFKPLSVPMGITVGSALLQLVAQTVFRPLADRSIILQDNIIVGLMPDDDPRAILIQLLDLCVKHDVTLAINKCEFVTPRTIFWGYLLEHGTFSIDPVRRQGIAAIPIPRSLKHAQRFCGLANFFASFIPQYREKAECVLAMLRSNYPFEKHTPATVAGFEALKAAMIDCQSLFMARRDLGPWILRCDASNIGAAAVLLQRCPLHDPNAKGSIAQEEDGFQLQPIAMISVPLSDAARAKWSTHTAELYAIVQGCKSLANMIDGHPLIIETDHNNLLYAQSHHAALTTRWLMYLQSNFNIVAILHRPGVRNVLADTLSRLYSMSAVQVETFLDSYSTATQAVSELARLRGRSSAHPYTHLLAQHVDGLGPFALSHDDISVSDEPRGEASALYDLDEDLNPVTDGMQPSAPDPGRGITVDEAFRTVHNARAGHLGWRRTMLAMKARFPDLPVASAYVKALVDNCPTCTKYRGHTTTNQREVLHSLPIPSAPGYISADCFRLPEDVYHHTHVLVIVNHATKMVDLQPMLSKESAEICKALYAHFCREGVPGMVLTDPGAELNNGDVDALLHWLNIKHGLSLVKRPQGHGTEKTIGRVKAYLAILIGEENALKRWSDRTILPAAQLFINASFNSEIGAVPMHLRYGTVQLERFQRLLHDDLPPVTSPSLLADIDANFKAMQGRANDTQALMKGKRRQKGLSPELRHSYQKGDYVLWQSDAILRPHGSLTAWLLGPYEVSHQLGNAVHAVHLSSGKAAVLHHDRLILCTTSKILATELARQDFPGEALLLDIVTHRGDLLERSSLTFHAIFTDGEHTWLPYSAISNTEALDRYAQKQQCTKLLLAENYDEEKKRLNDLDITAILARGSSFEGHAMPRLYEIMWVSIYAFGRGNALIDFTLPDEAEYVLQAATTQITKKRIHLKFTHIAGLHVSWTLTQIFAFCSPVIQAHQRPLDANILSQHPGLAVALGAREPTKPPTIASKPALPQEPVQTEQLEARLKDGTWHPIIVQERHPRHLLAYVPSLDVEIDVSLERVRQVSAGK